MGSRRPFLFYSPEAGVTPHFAAHCLVARTLKERGYEVLMARCQGLFPRCPVMDMHGLPYGALERNRATACPQCHSASTQYLSGYGLEALDLGALVSPEAVRRVSVALARLDGDLEEFAFDGHEFGRICMQDLVLATKISDFRLLGEEHRIAWIDFIRSAVLSYVMVGEACRRLPLAGVVVYNDYALLAAARLAAERHGVPAFTLGHASHLVVDRRRIMFADRTFRASDLALAAAWPTYRDLALPPRTVREAADDILMRLAAKGSHVYSPAKTFAGADIRAQLGVPSGKRLLAAFTSSLDERLAANALMDALHLPYDCDPQIFTDQVHWLKELAAFVEGREDLFLAVRVHPREGANKRESTVSQHLRRLREEFDRPFRNCLFLWPEDKLSSYDLGESADLALTSWSSIGIELARLAVPVLAYARGVAPWPWEPFHERSDSPEDYFRKLEEMLERAPDGNALLLANRWYHYYVLARCLDFGDAVPAHDFSGLAPYRLPREAAAVQRILAGGEQALDINRNRLKESQGEEAERLEAEEMQRQARRVLHFLFTGENLEEDYRLVLVVGAADPASFPEGEPPAGGGTDRAWLLADGPEVHFIRRGRVRTRRSPMARRLGFLGCQAYRGEPKYKPWRAAPEAAEPALAGDWVGVGGEVPGIPDVKRMKDQGRIEEALRAAQRMVSEGMEDPEALNLLGHLRCLAGREEEGFRDFQEVVRRWPSFAAARSNLGVMLWNRGDRSAALEQITAACEDDPGNREIVLNAARVYQAIGRIDAAEQVCSRYLHNRGEDDAVRRVLQGLGGGS